MSPCPVCGRSGDHTAVWVSWALSTVLVEHFCPTCRHEWSEPANDEAAVLAKVGLKRIAAVGA